MKKGQISWVWSFMVSTLALLIIIGFFIILDQSKARMNTPIRSINTDTATLTIIDSMWSYAPVAILVSWGMFQLIIAAQSRGQM